MTLTSVIVISEKFTIVGFILLVEACENKGVFVSFGIAPVFGNSSYLDFQYSEKFTLLGVETPLDMKF